MPVGSRLQVTWFSLVLLGSLGATTLGATPSWPGQTGPIFQPAEDALNLQPAREGELLSQVPSPCDEHAGAEEDCGLPSRHVPLGSRLMAAFETPEGRYCGPGHPLLRESWQNRQFSVGGFLGTDLSRVGGLYGGARLGWDGGYYWGGEMRFTFGSEAGYDNQFLWDVDLLYYPWGDAAWRPYFLLGAGAARLDFDQEYSARADDSAFVLPVGLGVKYRCNRWLAVRLECTDNVMFSGGVNGDARQVVLLSGAVEFRFGGPHRSYWPWNPGIRYW